MGEDPAGLPADKRAQAEPHIARSPLDPDLLVATFQEGRHTDGGAVNIGTAVSTNGGLTWSRSLLPSITTNLNGPYFRATDPVVAFDAKGNVLINTLGGIRPDFSRTALLLSVSTNRGTSFGPPKLVFQASAANEFADKNWMAVNRFTNSPTAGRIAVSFTLFRGAFSPIQVCHSDDGGETWTIPVYVTAPNVGCQGSTPLFLPDGSLAITYWNFGNSFANTSDDTLEVAISPDGGLTFNPPIVIGTVTEFDDRGVRDGFFLPSAAVDANEGILHVTCQATVNGSPRILHSRSTDFGKTWSPLTVVSDNPEGVSVFNPAIDVSPDGKDVVILFADKRRNPTETLLADYFVALSSDGGETWRPNLRISSQPVDMSLAPLTGTGRMIGDYFGVAAPIGTNVPLVAAVIGTSAGGPDPIALRAGSAASVDFASWRAARFSLAEQQPGGAGSALGDGDGDGLAAFQEYAFGLDPRGPDAAAASARIVLSQDRSTVTLLHQRQAGAGDLDFLWEVSEDSGISWQQPAPLRTSTVNIPGTTREEFGAEFPLQAATLLQFRLKVLVRP